MLGKFFFDKAHRAHLWFDFDVHCESFISKKNIMRTWYAFECACARSYAMFTLNKDIVLDIELWVLKNKKKYFIKKKGFNDNRSVAS